MQHHVLKALIVLFLCACFLSVLLTILCNSGIDVKCCNVSFPLNLYLKPWFFLVRIFLFLFFTLWLCLVNLSDSTGRWLSFYLGFIFACYMDCTFLIGSIRFQQILLQCQRHFQSVFLHSIFFSLVKFF